MTPLLKHARPLRVCRPHHLAALLLLATLGGCRLNVLDGLDEAPDRDAGLDDCVGAQCALCENEQTDPLETAVDCGGSTSGCPRCGLGKTCQDGSDCASSACTNGRCSEASCSDDTTNGDETDVDCGGGTCDPCATDRACEQPRDCADGVCTEQVCVAASCPDGVQNGPETDLDCGGGCGLACAPDRRCKESSDCDGLCVAERCRKPYPAGEPWALPGLIQAEDFDEGEGAGFVDDTPENLGSSDYRASAVDLDGSGVLAGAVGVAYTNAGEELAYTVRIAAAGDDYHVELRAVAGETKGRVHLALDGEPLGEPIDIPASVDTADLTVVERNGLTLPAGDHVLRLVFETPGVVLDWLRVSRGRTPFGGRAWPLPGTVQAEDFDVGGQDVAYRASLPRALTSRLYRATDVDLEACADTGGGFDVTGVLSDDWLDYTVDIAAAATYVLRLRVATDDATRHVTLQIDGNDLLVQRALPDTGGFRTYSTLAYPNLSLTAGPHTIRVLFPDGRVNLNWFSLE